MTLSNLDAKLRVQMRGELKRLQHTLGTTTIDVTHDQAEAMTLAHRVAIMRNCKLQQFDTPMNIYNRPANRFVAEFVGSPGMNFIEGRIDAAARRFAGDALSLILDDSQLARLNGTYQVTLGIRPEHIEVSIAERDGWPKASVYVTELMETKRLSSLLSATRRLSLALTLISERRWKTHSACGWIWIRPPSLTRKPAMQFDYDGPIG